MHTLTTEDLWPVLDRVAASQPESADNFVDAVLRELHLPRYSRYLCNLFVHRCRHLQAHSLASKLGAAEAMRRFDMHAFILLTYIAGVTDARHSRWTDVVRLATSNYELVVIEVDHALEQNGKMPLIDSFEWRRRPSEP